MEETIETLRNRVEKLEAEVDRLTNANTNLQLKLREYEGKKELGPPLKNPFEHR